MIKLVTAAIKFRVSLKANSKNLSGPNYVFTAYFNGDEFICNSADGEINNISTILTGVILNKSIYFYSNT
jgi:hypothetical protein